MFWDGGRLAKPGKSVVEQGWMPVKGDCVRISKMGGKAGTVVGSSPGGSVQVVVGRLTLTLRAWELEPADDTLAVHDAKHSPRIAGRRRVGDVQPDRKPVQQAPEGEGESGPGPGTRGPILLQTARNTVDIRGERADDGVAVVDNALRTADAGDCLYVVHGVGSGKLKAAVREFLRQHKEVQQYEDDPKSGPGCTLVIIKP
ncbi:unnamed protein product [Ostreobium quekettii]|uniref:Smr domain-containing protein n=1 Tax=Ostreobium quekettii TaxID=121088 RepID=A0A8S1J035_9CHLO|nr:unnamed protein product [Ostreobium quekettii]